MSDERTLLELAAKAAGIVGRFSVTMVGLPCIAIDGWPFPWQPLQDDGDALRLAANLEIDVTFRVAGGKRVEVLPPRGPRIVEPYTTEDDRTAATRLAIVKAAAALAEKME